MLDAVARFEFSPKFNIWVGRFLPPSDRANLYGPYYSHHWAVYTDGIQDGYPFVFQGRDNGVVYWGQFGKVKVSAGAFDGASATGDADVLGAGRVQVDFWDPESGYYLNGTYYGDKNLLAIGGAGQAQGGDKTATTSTSCSRRSWPDGGVVSVESEYANYDRLGGYDASYGDERRRLRAGQLSVPASRSASASSRSSASSPRPTSREGVTALDPTTTRRPPRSTSTTSSRSSTRA